MTDTPTPVTASIHGYRQLSDADQLLINQIKDQANDVGRLVEAMMLNGQVDTRWVATARTTLQTGFMQLVRAVAQPTSF